MVIDNSRPRCLDARHSGGDKTHKKRFGLLKADMHNQKHLYLHGFKELNKGRVYPDSDVKYDQMFLDKIKFDYVCFDAFSLSPLFIWQRVRNCFISDINAFDIWLYFIRI